MAAKKLNWRQARWSLLLARFNFILHHRPGKTMGKSDALSQRVDHGTGMEDNMDYCATKEKFMFRKLISIGKLLPFAMILR